MQEIVPRIQKKHPKLDERGMETAIAKLFSNRTAGDLFVTMFRERANIGKQIKAGQEAYSVDQLVSTGKNTAQGQGIDLEAKNGTSICRWGRTCCRCTFPRWRKCLRYCRVSRLSCVNMPVRQRQLR